MNQKIGYPKFLRDTAVTKLEENIWEAKLTDDWNIGGVAMEVIRWQLPLGPCRNV